MNSTPSNFFSRTAAPTWSGFGIESVNSVYEGVDETPRADNSAAMTSSQIRLPTGLFFAAMTSIFLIGAFLNSGFFHTFVSWEEVQANSIDARRPIVASRIPRDTFNLVLICMLYV